MCEYVIPNAVARRAAMTDLLQRINAAAADLAAPRGDFADGGLIAPDERGAS